MTYTEKQETIWFLRGHTWRCKQYNLQRQEILLGCRNVESAAIALDKLDTTPIAKQVHTVISAYNTVGGDIQSDQLRAALRKALANNIANRNAYPYERLYIPGISRHEFYRYRNELLDIIYNARNIGHCGTAQ